MNVGEHPSLSLNWADLELLDNSITRVILLRSWGDRTNLRDVGYQPPFKVYPFHEEIVQEFIFLSGKFSF